MRWLVYVGLIAVLLGSGVIIPLSHAQEDDGFACRLSIEDCLMLQTAFGHLQTMQSVYVDAFTIRLETTSDGTPINWQLDMSGALQKTEQNPLGYNADFTVNAYDLFGSEVESGAFAVGGQIRIIDDTAYLYDPATDTWVASDIEKEEEILIIMGFFMPYAMLDAVFADAAIAEWGRVTDGEAGLAGFTFTMAGDVWVNTVLRAEMTALMTPEEMAEFEPTMTVMAEQFSNVTITYTLYLHPDTQQIVDFSFVLDGVLDLAPVLSVAAGVESLPASTVSPATITISATLSDYNEAITLEMPPLAETNTGASVLNDPRFAAYQGIPFTNVSIRQVPLQVDVAQGVEHGMLPNGTPYIGSMDAPLVLAEFIDFSCPHCTNYLTTVEETIMPLVRRGLVRLEIHFLTFVGQAESERATIAALCAAGHGVFWEYHHDVFALQRAGEAFSEENLLAIAESFGLNMAQFEACLAGSDMRPLLEADDALSTELNVLGTPTLVFRTEDSTAWTHFTDADGNNRNVPTAEELVAFAEELLGY